MIANGIVKAGSDSHTVDDVWNEDVVVGPRTIGLTDEPCPGDVVECPVPFLLRASVEAYLDGKGPYTPVEPRLAATAMLVRDSTGQRGIIPTGVVPRLEVFMMRRARSMAFLPEAMVFPGGSVDRRDLAGDISWAGPDPATWAIAMGCDEEKARGIVIACAREVFEECGVLLAGSDPHSTVDVTGEEWFEDRRRLSSHEVSFSQVLDKHDLMLRSDFLILRSHWVTPVFESRRYDTYFFAAHLPTGQHPDGHTTEATSAGWVDPHCMLERFSHGEALLVPPTISNLAALSRANDVDTLFKQNPSGRIMLEPVRAQDGSSVLRCVLP